MIHIYQNEYKEIDELFQKSVHSIAQEKYSQAQLDAWAPHPIDYEHWKRRLELKRPFLYIKDNSIAGFLELDTDGHIDCLYVHPEYSRQGVASALLEHAIEVAKSNNIKRLYVEASHLIRPLFEKYNFTVINKNTVTRRGVDITNWIMHCNLD